MGRHRIFILTAGKTARRVYTQRSFLWQWYVEIAEGVEMMEENIVIFQMVYHFVPKVAKMHFLQKQAEATVHLPAVEVAHF